MSTKTITIIEDAYRALLKEKKNDESFSEVILKLTGRRGRLSDSFGKWEVSDAELKEIKKELDKGWKNFGSRYK